LHETLPNPWKKRLFREPEQLYSKTVTVILHRISVLASAGRFWAESATGAGKQKRIFVG
jgi:hypothetical protein